MRKFIDELVNNDSLKSFLHTLLTDLLYDAAVGAAVTNVFVQGDFSKTAVYALGYSFFRTILRALRKTFEKNVTSSKD